MRSSLTALPSAEYRFFARRERRALDDNSCAERGTRGTVTHPACRRNLTDSTALDSATHLTNGGKELHSIVLCLNVVGNAHQGVIPGQQCNDTLRHSSHWEMQAVQQPHVPLDHPIQRICNQREVWCAEVLNLRHRHNGNARRQAGRNSQPTNFAASGDCARHLRVGTHNDKAVCLQRCAWGSQAPS